MMHFFTLVGDPRMDRFDEPFLACTLSHRQLRLMQAVQAQGFDFFTVGAGGEILLTQVDTNRLPRGLHWGGRYLHGDIDIPATAGVL